MNSTKQKYRQAQKSNAEAARRHTFGQTLKGLNGIFERGKPTVKLYLAPSTKHKAIQQSRLKNEQRAECATTHCVARRGRCVGHCARRRGLERAKRVAIPQMSIVRLLS